MNEKMTFNDGTIIEFIDYGDKAEYRGSENPIIMNRVMDGRCNSNYSVAELFYRRFINNH